MTRRDFYRYGSIVLGGLVKLAIAVPAVAFLVSPLRQEEPEAGDGHVRDADQPRASSRWACRDRSRSSRIGPTPG